MLDSYTTKTYWISFGVIAALSFFSLFFFSRFLFVLTLRMSSMADSVNSSISKGLIPRKARRA